MNMVVNKTGKQGPAVQIEMPETLVLSQIPFSFNPEDLISFNKKNLTFLKAVFYSIKEAKIV